MSETNATEEKESKSPGSNSESVSVLYVKRKRNESANPSLFVQFNAKRQKIFNEFKFVTSTDTEPKTLDREELYKKYKHENTVSDIKEKCRRDVARTRKHNKYSLVSSRRSESGALFSAAVQDDHEEEEDIVCNAEKLLLQKLSLKDDGPPPFISNGTEEWIYDVYLCETSCEGNIDLIHSEQFNSEFDLEPAEKERYVNEYDEDSNDENYWANDYPDEEDSNDSDSNDSDSDKGVGNMRCSNEYFHADELGLNGSSYLDRYVVSDTDSD